MSFLIAKQPIFNREGKRVVFEVFLRKRERMYEYPKEVPYSRATYIIIDIILELGMDKVGEGEKVMINVSLDSIINKAIESLNPKKLIIEIIEPQIPVGEVVYNQILNTIDKYLNQGVLFSLDEKHLENEKMSRLVDKVQIISVDINRFNKKIVDFARSKSKSLLISKIENDKDYNRVVSFGDLFQGRYLESPIILKEFQSTPYLKNTLIRLIALAHSAQSPKEIADIIITDVGMTAKILRIVNSAYYSPIKEIKSIEQACAIIGLKNLKNLLLALAMNDYVSIENPELWKKSLARAIIAQKIAEIISPQNTSKAYILGLFSLIDEILNVDKIAFLKEVRMEQDIIDGYTGKNPHLRSILDYSIALEQEFSSPSDTQEYPQEKAVANLESLTGIDRYTLFHIAKSSFEMADNILKV